MENPVGNIKVGFYAFPDKNNEINYKPEITLGLKQFINICNKKSSEKK
jgi:hypothetical protein